MKKIKIILAFLLLFNIACELNLGGGDKKDKNGGGGCQIRLKWYHINFHNETPHPKDLSQSPALAGFFVCGMMCRFGYA